MTKEEAQAGSPVPRAAADSSGPELRRLLRASPLGAIELVRPSLTDLPYGRFVEALLGRQGFKLDFNAMSPAAALALVSDTLLGPDQYRDERAALAAEIAELAERAAAIVSGRAAVAVRTFFSPGDLVWHLDRMQQPAAIRLLWPLGRPAGMRVTSPDNIDEGIYAAFMRREFPQLTRLDAQVMHAGAEVERQWAHRPQQLAAMRSGRFPFIRDPSAEFAITPGAISIHRVETPAQRGTFHRSHWANRDRPGFQIVITAVSDRT